MNHVQKIRRARWADLRAHNPELFEELAQEYRKKHAHKIRKRTRDWKKANRERYNAWQRSAYERNKNAN